MRITRRRQPSERGLASVCQAPRGAVLKVDGEDVGRVCAYAVGFGKFVGWYWWAASKRYKVALRNTAANDAPRYATVEEAKASCEEYVRACIRQAARRAAEAPR